MKRLIAAFAALCLALPAGLAWTTRMAGAQEFPTRGITMIVVFAPGGATDVLARIVADHMSRTLHQRVVVENVTGAGGTIGGARGAQAAPDGYTLTVGSLGSHAAAPSIYRNIAYDPRELQPIGLIAGTPMFFVVRNGHPAQTMAEFLAMAREHPGRISNANAGIGSTNHLACALFSHLTGARMNDIPYRGEGPAMNDVVAQQVDSACLLAPAAVPQIAAGTLRALLVAATERNPNAAAIPSAPEAGVPDYIFQGWNAVFAPRGTPPEVVARLDAALRAALADPAIQRRIGELGSLPAQPAQQGPEALRGLLRTEVPRWATVIRAAGIEQQ
ncbi:tripartite tricarboxylate transporter substrate-binding protein [Sediminicoccus sp. KRV36]|uniref:Bug family tripartite tricarboxylate transporter substrate binding protein n=1 Tax=Sediminicoccus sp. KRV36 TaxID=3133721 RepID=UPI00200D9CC1|nr:tripartite tricarboxylate transporter substrate-binding protein [Sediminicoccus rosea]UPY37089.1 tripartite tricarboxylate transporter substrate binding protein BugD [Sediminicoccus rosea]